MLMSCPGVIQVNGCSMIKTPQTHIDKELIDRCLHGDPESWSELVYRYQRLVYSTAHALCPAAHDVSEPSIGPTRARCLEKLRKLVG